jgi:sec-independent protein translocase protein TatA
MNPAFLATGHLGTWEMVIIAMLVLVLFGARKLPTFSRALKRSMGQLNKARKDFERELTRAQVGAMKSPEKENRGEPAPARVTVGRSFWSQKCTMGWLLTRVVILPCV